MNNDRNPTIGLEIHAELKTQTKMFCNSKNDPNESKPNRNVCPICMAHPGTLPVINREAVRHVLRAGVAVGGKLADYTEFDRKNYFYPDLPKGYQISQYEHPLVAGGELDGVALTRIHLEEDTASSVHDEKSQTTTIDYNRAGIPLMELVTEPVITSAEQAGKFARELQLLLRYLGASDANMEKGEMRVEANISVGNKQKLGTKVEIKNLNSFKAMEKAIAYEIKRQNTLLEQGGKVLQETRGWDENKLETYAQRIKEGEADYRYFPDPDLPSLQLSEMTELDISSLKESISGLPWEVREQYLTIGIPLEDADMYVQDRRLGAFADRVFSELEHKNVKLASNYIATDLAKHIRDIDAQDTETQENIPISAKNFARLVNLIAQGEISSRGAKDILAEMIENDQDPSNIAKEKNLFQTSSEDELLPVIEEVLEKHSDVANDFKNGKESALQFLVGQAMRLSKGSANPQMLQEIFRKRLL